MHAPEVLISEDDIQKRVTELAQQISADYSDTGDLVMVGVLKGSFIFLADLSRNLNIPRTIEFIAVSSYGDSSVPSGAVRLVMDVRGNIEGKDVLIVEDIVDTGHTLKYLIGIMKSHRPASVKMEQDIPLAYLKRLDRNYESWIASYDMGEVLVLESDKLDYIHDLVHRLDVMERIEAVLPAEIGRPPC